MADWQPDWAGDFFPAPLQEGWRRLVVRLYVAARSLDAGADLAALGEILLSLDESPVVARQAIERRFALDAPL